MRLTCVDRHWFRMDLETEAYLLARGMLCFLSGAGIVGQAGQRFGGLGACFLFVL